MALKSSGARAQKRNKTKSLFKFKSRGHTGVIIRCRGRRLFKVEKYLYYINMDVTYNMFVFTNNVIIQGNYVYFTI